MRRISFILLVLVCTSAHAQDDAQSVHQAWAAKLRAATSLRVAARSSLLSGARILVTAAKPHKYRIELSDRTIVSNGSKVWNYSVERNSVVVSKLKTGVSAMSVETLLFDVIAAYKPVSLKNNNNSSGGSTYALRLEPAGSEKYGVRSMEITMDRATKRFRSILVELAQGKQSWDVESMALNVPVSKSVFEFRLPTNCEVVSMDDR